MIVEPPMVEQLGFILANLFRHRQHVHLLAGLQEDVCEGIGSFEDDAWKLLLEPS